MMSLPEIFRNFMLPALIVVAALAIGWWRGRDGRWIGGIAIAGAAAAAQCAIGGSPRWPPGTGDAAFWLVWFCAPVAVLGFFDALLRPPDWLRALILLIIARLGVRALLAPLAAHASADVAWGMEMWVDGISAAAVLWWFTLETQAERLPGATVPLILAVVAGGCAVMFGKTDNVKPAQAAMALAAIGLAAAALGWRVRSLSLARGGVLAFIVPLLGLMVFVHFYSYTEPPLISCGLILAAPLLAWAGHLPGVRRLGSAWRFAVRLILVAIVVALAVTLTVRSQNLNTGV